jgi:hypothetical protein
MTASLVATSSALAFFLGCGELAALTVATESADLTDSMDAATAATHLSDAEDELVPALEDFVGATASGSLEGLASSSDGAVVVDTRVPEVSGVAVVVAAAVVVLETASSIELLTAEATDVDGAEAILGFTSTRFSSVLCEPSEPLEDCTSDLTPLLRASESDFEEDSVTATFCSEAGVDSIFAGFESGGTLVLLLFTGGLELAPVLGVGFFTSAPDGFALLAGGSGGFPANGFKLLFLLRRVCCLLTAGDGPFFCGETLLFFLAGDGSREGAGDLFPFVAGGRGMREGDGCASFSPAAPCLTIDTSRCLFTLVFLTDLGDGALVFGRKSLLTSDTDARRFCVTRRLPEGDGSRDTGCERGIRDFPAGGSFLFSPGSAMRIDFADPGS